jgi:hypothetical protein
MAAPWCGKSCALLAGSFFNCAAEPGAGAKTRLTKKRTRSCVKAGREAGFRTGGLREDPADEEEDENVCEGRSGSRVLNRGMARRNG